MTSGTGNKSIPTTTNTMKGATNFLFKDRKPKKDIITIKIANLLLVKLKIKKYEPIIKRVKITDVKVTPNTECINPRSLHTKNIKAKNTNNKPKIRGNFSRYSKKVNKIPMSPMINKLFIFKR
ncbi:MAG: hypothetical protein ACP5OJ_02060 [Methanothermobacter sp.]